MNNSLNPLCRVKRARRRENSGKDNILQFPDKTSEKSIAQTNRVGIDAKDTQSMFLIPYKTIAGLGKEFVIPIKGREKGDNNVVGQSSTHPVEGNKGKKRAKRNNSCMFEYPKE
jgi:hypothetical protein